MANIKSKPSYCRTMADSMLSTIAGGTITGVFVTQDDNENHLPEGYGFTVKSTDDVIREVYVLMDPEGNGPGHLEIQKASITNFPHDEQIKQGSFDDGYQYALTLFNKKGIESVEISTLAGLISDGIFKQGFVRGISTIVLLEKNDCFVEGLEWHCHCPKGYVHLYTEKSCEKCGCKASNQDIDSRNSNED